VTPVQLEPPARLDQAAGHQTRHRGLNQLFAAGLLLDPLLADQCPVSIRRGDLTGALCRQLLQRLLYLRVPSDGGGLPFEGLLFVDQFEDRLLLLLVDVEPTDELLVSDALVSVRRVASEPDLFAAHGDCLFDLLQSLYRAAASWRRVPITPTYNDLGLAE
jgi:hypothetical protein